MSLLYKNDKRRQTMKYIRGWIGVGIFFTGIIMLFFEQTKSAVFLIIGFGTGMIIGGFN